MSERKIILAIMFVVRTLGPKCLTAKRWSLTMRKHTIQDGHEYLDGIKTATNSHT